jgi:L-ribulose-5-phosphate 3-epimerase
MLTRREWMRATSHAALVVLARGGEAAASAQSAGTAAPSGQPTFCLFSKHLPDLGWADVGRAVKDAGFDGVDLTVRPNGHVLPENAPTDLPRAIDAIRAQGVSIPMITTEITSASTPTARPLLQAASRHGVRYVKPGYWRYSSSPDVRAQVAATGEALAGLATLVQDCGIELGFHNHTAYIGAALWEIAPAIDRLDPRWVGYYFDPRHAVAEGGGGAWKAAMHLVAPRLKMVALKDFFWEKTAKGWTIRDCPLGEGQVDWTLVASTLRERRFSGPISLHLEYEIPGTTAQERTRLTLQAATRDLAAARRLLA